MRASVCVCGSGNFNGFWHFLAAVSLCGSDPLCLSLFFLLSPMPHCPLCHTPPRKPAPLLCVSKFMFAGYENEMTVVNILIKSKFGFWPVTIYFALVVAPFVLPRLSPPSSLDHCVFYFILLHCFCFFIRPVVANKFKFYFYFAAF